MNRLMIALALCATLLLALFPSLATACSCRAPDADYAASWFAEQPLIFEGEAVSERPLPADHPSVSGYFGANSTLVTFRVTRMIKGDPVATVEMLSVKRGSSACQMQFAIGDSGIYAPRLIPATDTWRASLCAHIIARSDEVQALIDQQSE